VTGGAGFIGCNFARFALAKTGVRLIVVDKLTYAGNLVSLKNILNHPRLVFIKGDIGNRPKMKSILNRFKPRAVLNFAAETHVDRSIDNPGVFVDTNIVGTFNLLEASRSYFQGLKGNKRSGFRFLHISTDEVFGTLGPGGRFKETTPYDPRSPYSASKAAADHLVNASFSTYKLPVLITNCSNNFGPFQYPEKLIPLTILNAAEGKHLPIYGDGKNVRDWLYVEDHCEAVWLVLNKGRVGEKYNIGGVGEQKNTEVVDKICEYLEEVWPAAQNRFLKRRKKFSYKSLKTFVPDRPGHDRRYAIDASKIRLQLHWKPHWGLNDGLRRTIRWYLANEAWCRAVQKGKYGRERLGLKND